MFNNLNDNFLDINSMINPIFKIMGNEGNMGSPIIEQEIQNHKDKLKDLISKLINTHNIDDETSINNEIKNQTEFLSSLFKIKKNEINQKNNNMNMNQMQQQFVEQQQMNPMMQQQMMQQQILQQQMLQQQLMQQQMMANAQAQAQQVAMNNILNNFDNQISNEITVFFRKSGSTGQPSPPIEIKCQTNEKVSEIIEKYRIKSGDYDLTKKFIFNARELHPNLSVAEDGIYNQSNVFVVTTKKEENYYIK